MNYDPAPPAPPPVSTYVRCPNCGYNLTGASIGSACPECGLIIGRGTYLAGAQLPTSGKAIASLVLGIVSIVGCSAYGILSVPCGIIAIILARGVNEQVENQQVSPGSIGIAKAGTVCGIVGLCLGGGLLLFVIIVILAGFLLP